ncbi:MAG: ABC transporter ATP-binding protein [Acidobacteriota bacterium]|nr:ABC transporter ATP-binding protein [Acidobacteriota bacterium]
MAELSVSILTKRFTATTALDALSLSVADGERLTILGPSGSGKTTLLRLVGGYETPTSGEVRLGGRRIDTLPPEQRNIGMVFQNYALFPHLDVAANVGFGLERRGVARDERARRVEAMLHMVRLDGLGARLPRQLSGGQQQRVALARALVIEPSLLLLDEPMSNLDARLREDVRHELVALQRSLAITTLLVTHDQEDALAFSDRVALLADGRLQQLGPPREIYDRPVNRFVAEFMGRVSLWPGRKAQELGEGVAEYVVGRDVRLAAPSGPADALVGVRPEAVEIHTGERPSAGNVLGGRVIERSFQGETEQVHVETDDGLSIVIRSRRMRTDTPQPGVAVWLSWPATRTIVVPADETAAQRAR